MARLALPRSLLGVLGGQHAGLRLYQWIFILGCVLGSLGVVAPRVLSLPVYYQAEAAARFDVNRYGGLYQNGQPGPDFAIATRDATEALQAAYLRQGEVRFGLPDFQVIYEPVAPGAVRVLGRGPDARSAQELADQGALELVRQVRAAGGREILRNLLGWEQELGLAGEPAASPFYTALRSIIVLNAYPLSLGIERVDPTRRARIEALPPEERSDLARALESRYFMLSAAIDRTDIELARARTMGVVQDIATLERQRAETLRQRDAVEAALRVLIDRFDAAFDADTPAAAYRVAANLPLAPQPRYVGPLLALAALVGLGFGLGGVALDQRAGVMPKLRELWAYRALIVNLVLRDLTARYKGSALGYLWTQLAPLLMLTVFYVFFTLLLQSTIALYPVFLIAALLPWNYCAEAVSSGARSVVDNGALVTKVFFPREVLPIAAVLSALINFVLSLPMLLLVIAVAQLVFTGGLRFSWTYLFLPVPLLVQTMLLLGLAFLLGALAVHLRDTVHLIGIVIQFWFFLTPVFYPLERAAGAWAWLVRWLNPMATLVEFYRELLYGGVAYGGDLPTTALPDSLALLRAFVTALVVLAAGYWYFQRSAGRFGEEI